jgi:hypothetical protein
MKKLQSLIMLAAGAAILFSSCNQSTGVSLTKRHYRKGYNVEIAGQRIKTKSQEPKISENERSELPEYASIQKTGEEYLKPNSVINEIDLTQNNSSTDLDKNNTNPVKKRKSIRLPHTPALASTFIKHIPELKKVFHKNQITTLNDDGDGHYHGGLIWTIIGILLAVWLISLLTGGWGLGGLIYIFLVVALVLILLRLLSVL